MTEKENQQSIGHPTWKNIKNHGFHVKSFDSAALKKKNVPLSIQNPMLSTPFKERHVRKLFITPSFC
jgi:hypothetical protein